MPSKRSGYLALTLTIFLAPLAPLTFLAGWATSLHAADMVGVHAVPTRTRASFEVVTLHNGEAMGLAGLHQDVFVLPAIPGLYTGIGGYGGATGERGGFFILGASAGWCSSTWQRFGLDIGAFAGGGGGTRDTGQGDGLMLRGQVLGVYDRDTWALQLGVASVDFPGGTIRSTQLTTGITVADTFTLLDTLPTTLASDPSATHSAVRWSITPCGYHYFLDDPTIGREGTPLDPNVNVVGIEFARHLTPHWRIPILLGGALEGNRAGYMDVSSGVIYAWGSPFSIEARALIGLAGGGSFQTGGGVILRPEIAAGYAINPHWVLEARAGRVHAIEGDFSGWTLGAAARWQPEQWYLADGMSVAALPTDQVVRDTWRLRVGNTTYVVRNDDHQAIQLIDVAVEKPMGSWFSIIGRTRSAYAGDAGSYSEGLFGARARYVPTAWLECGVEIDAGAGGGGGLETGDGLIANVILDAQVHLTESCSLGLGYGRMAALTDDFRADLINLTLQWGFGRALTVQ